ncbi:MAG: helix-turn-helix transcriptional regulator [Rubrivivax sp.]|nr:helix-turn-helix transcriptional regulator [Rubrivivax sp.]
MLDEAGNGMLLVDAEAQLLYANHPARLELDEEHPLRLVLGRLVTAQAGEAVALQEALAAAQRGLRRLLTLGRGEQRVCISVVPQADPRAAAPAGVAKMAALLILGQRRICGQLALHGYARAKGLTPAETRVLEQLRDDVQPTKIASHQGVAVSTVRTQIGSIRAKTGARSIRDLQRQLATLPPMVGALRSVAAACAGGTPRAVLAS